MKLARTLFLLIFLSQSSQLLSFSLVDYGQNVEFYFEVVNESKKTCKLNGIEDMLYVSTQYKHIEEVVIPEVANGYTVTSLSYLSFQNNKYIKRVTVPNSVTTIEGCAFHNSSIESVILSESLSIIQAYTFEECYYLSTIKLPNSVRLIGAGAFSGCSRLKSVEMSPNIDRIESLAFNGCSSLQTIDLPNKLLTIESFAFQNCSSLNSITIPSSVTSIGNGAFKGCTSFRTMVIPDNVTTIGNGLFEKCSNLLSVTLPNVKKIGDYMFRSCYSLTNMSIPSSVLSIGKGAYMNCRALTEIKLPKDLRTIEDSLFLNCANLTSVIMPDSITSIGRYAFHTCKSLTGIVIPKTVTSIGDMGFYGCTGLNTIVSKVKNPFPVSDVTFQSGYYPSYKTLDATLYVPYGTKSKYMEIDGWKQFSKIIESEDMDDGDTFNAITNEGIEMTFKVIDIANRLCQVGDGERSAIASSVSSVTIPESAKGLSVIKIAGAAFLNSSLLQQITVPNTIQEVGSKVFEGCRNLAAIIWNPEIELTSLILGDIHNPNLLLYVNNVLYAPSEIQNIVVNGVAEKIVLKEAINDNNFYCPEEFTAKEVEYTHNYSMTSGYQTNQGWETIALPFDVTNITFDTTTELVPIKTWTVGSVKRPFWLYEQTSEGWKAASAIKGNVPYIICMPNNSERYDDIYNIKGDVTFKGENVKVLASDNVTSTLYNNRRFVPNFQNLNASNSIYALNVNNQWDSYTSTAHLYGSTFFPNLRAVHPFEAYMTTNNGAARTFIPIFEDTTPTNILDIINKENNEKDNWYTLDGLQLQSKPTAKGIYINNSKKVIIK